MGSAPSDLARTPRTTLRRRPQRGSHDRSLVEAILDEGMVCHLAVRRDDGTMVLPMAYARIDDTVYLHGSKHNALLNTLGHEASLAVTLLDGLVLAKSAFHHSMNYRAVVLFGRPRAVTDAGEKAQALNAILEHALPGRARECRAPNAEELAATLVIAFPIDEGSAKVRSGPPLDLESDHERDDWAGVVPLTLVAGTPESEARDYPRSVERVLMRPRAWAVVEERRGELTLSTDRARLDLDLLHRYLGGQSYWARGITRPRLTRALACSLCVAVYHGDRQIGFARLVTDQATFAYLADVFVLEGYRGRGIASWMVEHLRARPELAGMRRWLLGTRDAHALYAKHGFEPLAEPERFMEILTPHQEA